MRRRRVAKSNRCYATTLYYAADANRQDKCVGGLDAGSDACWGAAVCCPCLGRVRVWGRTRDEARGPGGALHVELCRVIQAVRPAVHLHALRHRSHARVLSPSVAIALVTSKFKVSPASLASKRFDAL